VKPRNETKKGNGDLESSHNKLYDKEKKPLSKGKKCGGAASVTGKRKKRSDDCRRRKKKENIKHR